MKHIRKVWLQCAVFAAFAGVCMSLTAQELSLSDFGDQPLIRVTGTGKVAVKADVALVNLGAETQARTAEQARTEAAAAMQAMLESLKSAGVEDKDLQTQHLSLNPVYAPNSASKITGYTVQHQLTVKVRDVARVGTIVDEALKAGGDAGRMYGLSFAVDAVAEAESQARAAAYANALAKAQEYARAAGLTLGRPIRVLEMPERLPGPLPMDGAAMRMAEAVPTPIETGEQEVTATVVVVYNIAEPPQ